MEDLQCALVRKMDEMSSNNNEKFEAMKTEMKNEIDKIRSDFNNRMEGLAKKVETKVSKALDKKIDDKVKVNKNNIDKEMQKEMQKIRSSNDNIIKSVTKVEETSLPTLKEELGDEMDELNRRLKKLEEKVSSNQHDNYSSKPADDHKRSFIIKHLEERENENVIDRVNSLIYNGLKLDKVEVEFAVIGMDGYSWFSNNRNNIHIRAKKGSGGIGFLVKKRYIRAI